MSGSSDYTQTPNLGLYKPIANMAVGLWGDLWNSNADAIDAAIHSATGGGPYLPLAGGTMPGATTFTGALNWTSTGATTVRAAQDRSGAMADVKDFGAVIDGTTLDGTAIGAALAALKPWQAIRAPAGDMKFTWGAVQGTTPTTPVHWLLDGTTSGGAVMTNALNRPGKGDLFETFYGGTKYLTVESASVDHQGALRVDFFNTNQPGTASATSQPILVMAKDYAGAKTSIWAISAQLDMYSTQHATSGWPAHVGVSAAVRKHNTATGGPWATGIHITAIEDNNLTSVDNSALLGMEIAHHANNDDPGAATVPGSPGLRLGIHMSQSEQVLSGSGGVLPAVFAMGYNHDGSLNAITKSIFGVYGSQTYQVFDARTAAAPSTYAYPVAALRMTAGQIVDFKGADPALSTPAWTAPPGNYLQYTTTGGARLRYMVGATERLSFPDAKPVVSGSRGTATVAVLTALLTALNGAGIITDSTSA